jgi:hypothetical protein
MREYVPEWLPDWLKEHLTKPTMPIPIAGRAVYDAERGQSYALARQNVIPTLKAGRRRQVPTVWVRRQLMLDDDPAPSHLSGKGPAA